MTKKLDATETPHWWTNRKSRPGLSGRPKQATVLKPDTTENAWWYENPESIDVFVESTQGQFLVCRIYWRDLEQAHRRKVGFWRRLRSEAAKVWDLR